jgi:hypothetical protein
MRGQYQEQGRQENARAVGALTGSSKQNYFNALTSGIGAAGIIQDRKERALDRAAGINTSGGGGSGLSGVTQSLQNLQQKGNPNSFYQPTLSNPYLMNQSVPNPNMQPQGTNTPNLNPDARTKRFLGRNPSFEYPNPYID